MRKIVLAVLLISSLIFGLNSFVRADETTDKYNDLQKQIEDLTKKLSEVQDRAKTLASQISYMDNQIKLTTLKIVDTEEQIKEAQDDIAKLVEKIGKLENSLTKVSEVLIKRIAATYKSGHLNNFFLFLSSSDFSEVINRTKYLRLMQEHDKKLMFEIQSTKTDFEEEKKLLEEKKKQLDQLKVKMESQKITLDQQKNEKQALLDITRNDEMRYQELLNKARAEIASLKSFTSEHDGGILPPQNSPDGWYYSQRDERWAYKTIGYSSETIYDVGCLISDVAMMFTFYGDRKTPNDIASNASYFFSSTAYMLNPWPAPSGKSAIALTSMSEVNNELSNGRPVIVHLNLGGDGHFIVLKKQDGDGYIMHDPWFGYDKKFSDYYSLVSIDTKVAYR